jgi:transposase
MASYIGVDVGKKSLHVYLPTIGKPVEFANNQQGCGKFLSLCNKYYNDLSDIIIVFEPTGGYERKLSEFLKFSKVSFAIVHPNKVRAYAKARGLLAKADGIDARLLAEYGNAFTLSAKQEHGCPGQQELHALIQRREQLILFKNQEIARLENQHNNNIVKSIKLHLSQLDKQLLQIQKLIDDLCNNDPIIKDKVTRLTSIPGVGITLATTFICEVPQLDNVSFSQLTAFAGLAPYARESGSYKGRRAIFAGRKNLRKVLYMAAVASLRCNKRLKDFYQRLIANHKPPKVALVAVMRKLLAFIYGLLINNSSWRYDM